MVAVAVLFASVTSVIATGKTENIVVTVTNAQKQPINGAAVHVRGDDVRPPLFVIGYTKADGTYRFVVWSRARQICFQAQVHANGRPYSSSSQCFYPPYPANVDLEIHSR